MDWRPSTAPWLRALDSTGYEAQSDALSDSSHKRRRVVGVVSVWHEGTVFACAVDSHLRQRRKS